MSVTIVAMRLLRAGVLAISMVEFGWQLMIFALQAFRISYVKALELELAFLSSMSGDVVVLPCPEASL